jgi:GT2 family glycosyltransferase
MPEILCMLSNGGDFRFAFDMQGRLCGSPQGVIPARTGPRARHLQAIMIAQDLSILIPSYNGRGHLHRCLTALRVAAPGAEVIVVDGSSTDGSPEMVEREFPEVRLSRVPNHGWAHASNRAAEMATRDYYLFLNSDAFVTEEALAMMHDRLTHSHETGAVAPMLMNEDGTRQKLFGVWYWPVWRPVTRPLTAPVLSGACFMATRRCFERVGAFDETFFLYNEEFDWGSRARALGYRLEILATEVVHVGGGSTARSALLEQEAQRGFVYLSEKHWPEWVTRGLREVVRIEAWLGKHLDPRPRHRIMWESLESTMQRKAYTESPFELSGRGVPPMNFSPDPQAGQ